MLLILSALLVIFETSYVTHKFSYEGAQIHHLEQQPMHLKGKRHDPQEIRSTRPGGLAAPGRLLGFSVQDFGLYAPGVQGFRLLGFSDFRPLDLRAGGLRIRG